MNQGNRFILGFFQSREQRSREQLPPLSLPTSNIPTIPGNEHPAVPHPTGNSGSSVPIPAPSKPQGFFGKFLPLGGETFPAETTERERANPERKEQGKQTGSGQYSGLHIPVSWEAPEEAEGHGLAGSGCGRHRPPLPNPRECEPGQAFPCAPAPGMSGTLRREAREPCFPWFPCYPCYPCFPCFPCCYPCFPCYSGTKPGAAGAAAAMSLPCPGMCLKSRFFPRFSLDLSGIGALRSSHQSGPSDSLFQRLG